MSRRLCLLIVGVLILEVAVFDAAFWYKNGIGDPRCAFFIPKYGIVIHVSNEGIHLRCERVRP